MGGAALAIDVGAKGAVKGLHGLPNHVAAFGVEA